MSKIKTQSHSSNTKSDIKIRAYSFSLEIIAFISSLPRNKICLTLSDQLLRSATSIGADIVEAKSSSSRREFIKYYEISLKSSNETKYWICLFRDSKLIIDTKGLEKLLKEAVEISNILASSLLTLKGKNKSSFYF